MKYPTNAEVRAAIHEAMEGDQRHVHAAGKPCTGCVTSATHAVMKLLQAKEDEVDE